MYGTRHMPQQWPGVTQHSCSVTHLIDIAALTDSLTQPLHTQLETVQANPSYVVELSANIDRVDGLLAAFKQWQAASMADLASQEALLEEEIDAAVFRIEDEMAAQPTVKPQAAPTSRHHLSHEAWYVRPCFYVLLLTSSTLRHL